MVQFGRGRMELRDTVVGFALMLGLMLTGCGKTSTVVMDGQNATQGITVQASSEVKVVPNRATFNVTINTTGSKANDIEITSRVLTMKNLVEEIREQIQNLV